MKTTTKARLRIRYAGKLYAVAVEGVNYAGTLIVHKLKIGHTRFWLVLQNGMWRFISDMPLCLELKNIILPRVAALHGLAVEQDGTEQVALRTGILLNAILNLLASKKELPV